MQAVYQRWAGLNKCSADALIEDDAKDVAEVYTNGDESLAMLRVMLPLININTFTQEGRSSKERMCVGNTDAKVKRVFTGEALCIGLNLDITLNEEQMRQEFRKSGNLSVLTRISKSSRKKFADAEKFGGLKGWCELQDEFFQDYPEILTELTVHLTKKVQEVGTLRAFLDCTTASVDEPNLQGTKKNAWMALFRLLLIRV